MKEELEDKINQLKNLFVYRNGILLYDRNTQDRASDLLIEIATITETFDKTIKKEKKNIENELVIMDSNTGEEIELVDTDSIDVRVRNVLEDNNVFSCLKSLALSNKCAHVFDGEIKKLGEICKKYYNFLYPNEHVVGDITFMQPLSSILPKARNCNIYNISTISDNDFEEVVSLLYSNRRVNKGTKISVLRQLDIIFDIRSDEDINDKFYEVVLNKDKIVNAFLVRKYKEGMQNVKLQNKMFAVKNNYISMIGQLLKTDKFNNVKYELIKTPGAKPGFEYMLIVDDRELSYYIEVHMPNFIAKSLIKEYGLVESSARTTSVLGASAVYKRSKKEVREIKEALNNNTLGAGKGRIRGRIISRGVQEGSQQEDEEKIDDDYKFITKKIVDESSEFEDYLNNNHIYQDVVSNANLIRLNENYSQNVTNKIINDNYFDIYRSFDDDKKIDFVFYSLNKLKKGDAFDKDLCRDFENNLEYNDFDIIAKMIIYKNDLKREFVNNNIDKIDEIIYGKDMSKKYYYDYSKNYDADILLTDNNKKDMDTLITKYVDNYLKSEEDKKYKEEKKSVSKYKR